MLSGTSGQDLRNLRGELSTSHSQSECGGAGAAVLLCLQDQARGSDNNTKSSREKEGSSY
jgi:hypothetical protein